MESSDEFSMLTDNHHTPCLNPVNAPFLAPGVTAVKLAIKIYNRNIWFGDVVDLRVGFTEELPCDTKVKIPYKQKWYLVL